MKARAVIPAKPQNVMVVLTPEEVEFVTNCILHCPVQTDVASMPALIGMAQTIVKKLQQPASETQPSKG